MEIGFVAEIKELKCKTTADECLTGRIVLEFPPTDEVFIALKKLYQHHTTVSVNINGGE